MCSQCDEIEDLEHTLYHCVKWLNTRAKCKVLQDLKPISKIFEEQKVEELKSVVNFLKIINIQV